jgi:insertion element IS1 protein InsB
VEECAFCPRCGSVRVVKSGHVRGRQRWLCRRCQYQFTRRDGYGTPVEVKQAAVTLYGYGLSLNAVGHLLGSCAQSVMRWVCSYVDHHCPKLEPEPVPIIEIDEMWHYLHRRTNRVWIWKAYDREKDRLIDWECGGRDEATFRRLFARLERWKPRLYCTDDYVVYNNVPPVGRHYVGKDESVCLERNNGLQRHWVASCRRRSIVVSRSGAMINRRIALFAHLHVNRQARPEMRRLSIARERRLKIA